MMWWTVVGALLATAAGDSVEYQVPQSQDFYVVDSWEPEIKYGGFSSPYYGNLLDGIDFNLDNNENPVNADGVQEVGPGEENDNMRAPRYVLGGFETTNDIQEVQGEPSKRQFSPWGGKRSDNRMDLKRNKDNNMPKRVRFSPWGGKRSIINFRDSNRPTHYIYHSMPFKSGPFQRRFPTNTYYKSPNSLYDNISPVIMYNVNPKVKSRLVYDLTQTLKGLDSEKDYNRNKRKLKFNGWGRNSPILGHIVAASSDDGISKVTHIKDK